jgi:hypothetical protein
MPWFSDRAGSPSDSHNAASDVVFRLLDNVDTLKS